MSWILRRDGIELFESDSKLAVNTFAIMHGHATYFRRLRYEWGVEVIEVFDDDEGPDD